jgi:uncharacterized cupin superfamily protein
VSERPIVVPPGEGHRIGNVEFLARTVDTPRFTFGIIDIAPGREVEAHVHDGEDDAFYILEGLMTFFFGDDEADAGPGTFVLAPAGDPDDVGRQACLCFENRLSRVRRL